MGTHCHLPGPWKCPLPVRALGGKPPSFTASVALASTEGARGWWSRPSWAKHPLNNTDNPEEGREGWRKASWSTAPTAVCSLAVESLFGHKLHSEASYGKSFFQLSEFNGNTHLLKFQTWPVAFWREDYLAYSGSLWVTEEAGILVTDFVPQLPHWRCPVYGGGGGEAAGSACLALPCVGAMRKMAPPLETMSPEHEGSVRLLNCTSGSLSLPWGVTDSSESA